MKKILGLTLASLLIIAICAVGTWAYFMDTETSTGNSLSAGTLDLSWTNQEGVPLPFNTGNMAPGDTTEARISVNNTGNLQLRYAMTTDVVSGTAMANQLQCRLYDYTISTSGFTETSTLAFSSGKKTRAAVIDATNGYAYFGTDDDPGKVVKINLSDFTEVSTLTFSSGTKTRAAVIDTANGYAYFGTDDDPGKVVKINLNSGELYNGPLSGAYIGNSAQGQQTGDKTLNSSSQDYLAIEITLPASTGNEFQGLSTNITFNFIAEQTTNNQ